MNDLNIAILGSNSHIARGLIHNFIKSSFGTLHLYTRYPDRCHRFLNSIDFTRRRDPIVEQGYRKFMQGHYDLIINCVGVGPPNKLRNNYSDYFKITEQYDNLAIDYLGLNPNTLYINFSSGAVYGKNFKAPVEENSTNCIQVNHITSEEYYQIANLNAEGKHRSLQDLKITDIRIFALSLIHI